MRSLSAVWWISDKKELFRSRKIRCSKKRREEIKPRPLLKGAGGGKRREEEDSLISGAPFGASRYGERKGESPRAFCRAYAWQIGPVVEAKTAQTSRFLESLF